jgi:hypothetical protein
MWHSYAILCARNNSVVWRMPSKATLVDHHGISAGMSPRSTVHPSSTVPAGQVYTNKSTNNCGWHGHCNCYGDTSHHTTNTRSVLPRKSSSHSADQGCRFQHSSQRAHIKRLDKAPHLAGCSHLGGHPPRHERSSTTPDSKRQTKCMRTHFGGFSLATQIKSNAPTVCRCFGKTFHLI